MAVHSAFATAKQSNKATETLDIGSARTTVSKHKFSATVGTSIEVVDGTRFAVAVVGTGTAG